MIPRSFPYPHPLFTSDSRELIERSPYYWWWEPLRRSDVYRSAVNGRPRGTLKSLVEDFGDVFSADFRTWWRTDQRGANLFAYPITRPSIEVLGGGELVEVHEERLLLSIDLTIPMADLTRRFRAILREHHSGEKGKQAARTTQAKYRLSGPPHIDAWRIGLQIYDIKKRNPTLKQWEVARLIPRIWNSHSFDPSLPSRQILDQKNRVQVLVSRHLSRTQRSINNAARGVFP